MPVQNSRAVSLDVIIPLFNEEEMIEALVAQLNTVFSPANLDQYGIGRVRFLIVDDGSRDRSAELLSAHIRHGFRAELLRLSRNFGHQNALCAGLDHADADVVAVIDADLQDPPELILDMIALWRQGHEVVYGQRRKRKESLFKRVCYWSFYRMIAFLADISIPLDSGDFCIMDRQVVEALRKLPEHLRFIRGLRAWVGFRQTGLPYDRPARRAGATKYSLGKLYRLATDGVASFSIRPLKVAQVLAFSYFVLTVAIMAVLFFGWLSQRHIESPAMLIAYLLIVSGNGALCLCVYILGAYVGRSYLEAKARPAYILRERIVNDERAPVKQPPESPAPPPPFMKHET